MKMFLDDIRFPKNDTNSWTIVRSFEEAVLFVCTNGIPDYISFDHDLGDSTDKTGYDFAKWLVEQDMNSYNKFPSGFSFNVHSANPVGSKNIYMYLENYFSHKGI